MVEDNTKRNVEHDEYVDTFLDQAKQSKRDFWYYLDTMEKEMYDRFHGNDE